MAPIVPTIMKTVRQRQKTVDIREAFNLWDLLKSCYTGLELALMLKNYAHDADLIVILDRFINIARERAKNLENELKKYSVQAPDRNRIRVNLRMPDSGSVTDEFIANLFFLVSQEDTEHMLRAFRTSVTNDAVRDLFKRFALQKAECVDILVHYLRLKGWLEIPPLYRSTPGDIHEKVTTVEVANLWDHLTFRYDNYHSTEVIRSLAHDREFVAALDMGLNTLSKQIAVLEKELVRFAVPLPKRPGKLTMTMRDTEVVHDEHCYRTLLIGLYGALALHVQPLKECVYNDRIRALFKQLLVDELGMLDRYLKFGKLKGWLNAPPLP